MVVCDALRNRPLSRLMVDEEQLRTAVANNTKARISWYDSGAEGDHMIAAWSGHTIPDVAGPGWRVPESELPAVLVHGTYKRHLDSIKADGLLRRTGNGLYLSHENVPMSYIKDYAALGTTWSEDEVAEIAIRLAQVSLNVQEYLVVDAETLVSLNDQEYLVVDAETLDTQTAGREEERARVAQAAEEEEKYRTGLNPELQRLERANPVGPRQGEPILTSNRLQADIEAGIPVWVARRRHRAPERAARHQAEQAKVGPPRSTVLVPSRGTLTKGGKGLDEDLDAAARRELREFRQTLLQQEGGSQSLRRQPESQARKKRRREERKAKAKAGSSAGAASSGDRLPSFWCRSPSFLDGPSIVRDEQVDPLRRNSVSPLPGGIPLAGVAARSAPGTARKRTAAPWLRTKVMSRSEGRETPPAEDHGWDFFYFLFLAGLAWIGMTLSSVAIVLLTLVVIGEFLARAREFEKNWWAGWKAETLLLFLARLAETTQKSYLSQWRWWELFCARRGVSPWRVALVVAGLKKKYATKERRRAVTPAMLQWLHSHLHGGVLSYAEVILQWGALCLAFFFLLRASEYLDTGYHSPLRGLRGRDLRLSRGGKPCSLRDFEEAHELTVFIRGSKTDVYNRGEYRNHYKTGLLLCSVTAATQLFKSFPLRFAVGPKEDELLFRDLEGKPLPRALVSILIRKAAEALGEPEGALGTHSLRFGGASALWAACGDAALVKPWGRWTSESFQTYIWDARATSKDVAKKMALTDLTPR
ncbi:hypothetical protein AK812_SmicGene12099 [Symbiodinium microadriaticum]|uniref:Tyr recombinase domain-containing protein n=1 Tax=Symbiodinium microadriaticum TaxID=2951 RepID=A0A1Q9EBJ4_SYMMI|nr:hypothetical protein AK812_SmicGene12099 [Symbiodinium microadriaticum]